MIKKVKTHVKECGVSSRDTKLRLDHLLAQLKQRVEASPEALIILESKRQEIETKVESEYREKMAKVLKLQGLDDT